ncbi:MAG: Gfo/Idh/MocA family oxidoreductase [Candidatus Helarchaeota archaeon]|nr:Gfo/Idh/MocA family oxidoreductase [Candidatus Helarchaeota archaeon]
MHRVKIGVVGGGIAARFHLAACKNSPLVKFVAVLDRDEKNAERIAKVYKLMPFSNLAEFLNSDIDAVLVAVPHFLHEEYVIAASEAGKHVLCEKPMATTLEGCDQMIAATRKSNVKFMVAENHRFLPAHQWIKDALQMGWVGKPFLIRSYEGVMEIPNLVQPDSWKGHPIKAGGGPLMDMGAHKFATLQWFLDDTVESAYAWLTRQCTNLKEKAEDNAMIFLKFKSGVIAETVVSFTVVTPPTNCVEIYGTKGTIIENHAWEYPIRMNTNHKHGGPNRGRWYEPRIIHGKYPKYVEISARFEDEHFAECILTNKAPEFTPEQAKAAIATALLGYLSAQLKRAATMDELMEIARTKGTKGILEGINEVVQNHYIG